MTLINPPSTVRLDFLLASTIIPRRSPWRAPFRSSLKRALALAVLFFAATGAWAANPIVDVKTSMGHFAVELYPAKAPKTVENFLEYVKRSFYDGTIFHRVIDGFMIQGGGFDPAMRQKATRGPVANEAEEALKKGLRNEIGTIAMARTPDPHSATAQFFINVKDNGFLDFRDRSPQAYGYTPFGRVVEGMDVVMRISKVETSTSGPFQNVPITPVRIESIKLRPFKK
jgi:cyclophilin family peptidyl-prolyl cis-trans isomerase